MKLFCRHDWQWTYRETVFGSDGNEKIGDMDVFICRKCGKVRRKRV